MTIYPAIDILKGDVVRMRAGDYATAYRVASSPLEAAKRFVGDGAEWLHVVDLDGARTGVPENLEHIRAICQRFTLPVQAGGGIRDFETAEQFAESGVSRIVVGTAAVDEPELIGRLVDRHADRMAVSVDAKSGYVVAKGWTVVTERKASELVQELAVNGVPTIVFTNVSVDGTLQGVDIGGLETVARAFGGDTIYSGGVATLADLAKIARLRHRGVRGAIVGRALYSGAFSLKEAMDVARAA
jgi:phosphoribosylformimino-5-aminoimidazole carboxamide ribotide isomerase